MRTCTRNLAPIAAVLVFACGGDPPRDVWSTASAGDTAVEGGSTGDGSSEAGGTSRTGGDVASDDGADTADDGKGFDLGPATAEGGDPSGDDAGICAAARSCVDTTADAAVLLEPCGDVFADFFPPYDEHYECWSGTPSGHMIGDTDVVFADDDPDLLLVGRWDGGIAQARVTRDAACNITGFADAAWQTWAASEPGDVFVRGMAFEDDGTMFIARSSSGANQQLGQRAPGTMQTGQLVDVVSVLPPWEDLFYGNENVAVALSFVPPGFPGEGSLKLLAEKLDTAHWMTVPLSADGTGTYDVDMSIEETQIFPPEDDWGGYYARGIAWVDADNPAIDVPSVLIPEAWHYIIALYELDGDGNPIPETRTPFVEGIGMPSGAETDAVSGNNFVFTGRRSQYVSVIRGCNEAGPSTDPEG